ncbi:MAG: hypothetical protein MUC45_08770 [Actinomycetia bacterium]|nr:hypothetical protein [Actinomycetes bacterium]
MWLLLGLVVVGGGAWLAVAASRRRAWDERYGGLLAEARWVHDSLAPSVTNRLTPDAQVQQQWPDGKRRLDDLQAGLYQLGPKVPDDTRAGRLNRVSGAVAALGSALTEDVALRGPAVASSAEALARSAQTVEACRGRLLAAIDDLPVDGS